MKRWLQAGLIALLPLLGGCTTLGYYWQSVTGHLSLMQAARPIEHWLANDASSPALKQRLQLIARIRDFASRQLHLPDNASYRSYADLGRPAALWNVVAAPQDSLQLQQWCFPVAGCVTYKGYFDEAQARQEAARLAEQGLETAVLPVPAYSTLGWLNWAGGDPLLNTFAGYPEGELARLIFHELAHQVVYVAGDTAFNESFATAVERLGGHAWLAQASDAARAEHALIDGRRRQWRHLALQLRRELQSVYQSRADGTRPGAPELRQARKDAYQGFVRSYEALKAGWGGYAGYDRWVAGLNNAQLAALAEYEDLTPGFEMLRQRAGSWPAFFQAVRRLAALPKEQRHALLQQGNTQTAGAPAQLYSAQAK
ncbi:MAG: aminopeptidase [Betaproteobacteria bacterium]